MRRIEGRPPTLSAAQGVSASAQSRPGVDSTASGGPPDGSPSAPPGFSAEHIVGPIT